MTWFNVWAEYFVSYGIGIFIMIVLAIFVHEASHFRKADKLGLHPKWNFKWKPFSLQVITGFDGTLKDQMRIIEDGFFNGFFVVLISILFLDYWSLLVLLMYLIGCKSDIKQWFRLRKALKGIDWEGKE